MYQSKVKILIIFDIEIHVTVAIKLIIRNIAIGTQGWMGFTNFVPRMNCLQTRSNVSGNYFCIQMQRTMPQQ